MKCLLRTTKRKIINSFRKDLLHFARIHCISTGKKLQFAGGLPPRQNSKQRIRSKVPSKVSSSLPSIIDPSILDLKWERTQKVTKEIHNQEKEEIVVPGLESQVEPWERRRNLVSVVEDAAYPEKAMDKGTGEITSSRSQWVTAKDTEK